MSFASVPRILIPALFLMAFAIQDNTTPDVEIKLTNGDTFQAKLIKFHEGVYTVRIGDITREIQAREVSLIKHQNEQDLPEKEAGRELPKNEDKKSPENNGDEQLGYLVTLSSDPSAKIGPVAWKKICDNAAKRLEAFGIDKTMVTRAASTMEIRLDKVEEKFAKNVVRLLTFKGEFVAYAGATLTDLEKEKYKEPNAPKGKKWLAKYESEEMASQRLAAPPPPDLAPVRPGAVPAPKPENVSQSVVVIDKPIPLRNFIESVDMGGASRPGVSADASIVFNMNGLKVFASLKENDSRTQVYISIDDQYLGTASPSSSKLPLAVGKTQATIIAMSYKYPIADKVTATIAPIHSDSDKFPAAKQR